MKKTVKLVLIVCLAIWLTIVITACATTGEKHEHGEAYLPKHFILEKHYSFYYLGGLNKGEFTSINIPSRIEGKTVEYILFDSFAEKGITKVIFPETIKKISTIPYGIAFRNDKGAFEGNKLTEVILPYGLVEIGRRAFANNELTEVIIPNTVERIGESAFAKNKLQTVEIPASVITLSIDAFDDNNFTKPIVIPDTVKYIYSGWYYDTFGDFKFGIRGNIVGSGKNRTITMSYGRTDFGIYSVGPYSKGLLTIPPAFYDIPVTRIAKNFCAGKASVLKNEREKITTLVLPTTLQEIEMGAFAFCDIAKVITPNKNIQDIWDEYFKKQQEADEIVYKKEYNKTVEELRKMWR